MKLAEKITMLRKKAGWSQEELAGRLDVSRQSVSKWESGLSVPDLDKLIRLSRLFDVTIDYLVKDEADMPEDGAKTCEGHMDSVKTCEDHTDSAKTCEDHTDSAKTREDHMDSDGVRRERADSPEKDPEPLNTVTVEQASELMLFTERFSKEVAFAVALFILSPVPLFLFRALVLLFLPGLLKNETDPTLFDALSIIVLLAMVAAGVAILIVNGMKMDQYEYITKMPFTPADGVELLASDRKEHYRPVFSRHIAAGVALCILSPVPLIGAAFLDESAFGWLFMLALSFLFLSVAIGVSLFIISGITWSCYDQLLQTGEYTPRRKLNEKANETIAGIYWGIICFLYLLVSFVWNCWATSWIIWPCAGVLFAVIAGILDIVRGRKE